MESGYPQNFINNALSEVRFEQRTQALLQRKKQKKKRILPFIKQYHPAVPNLKETLTRKWHLIQQQPLLNRIFQGASHNIIQRKPNHVFQSHVGLSTILTQRDACSSSNCQVGELHVLINLTWITLKS